MATYKTLHNDFKLGGLSYTFDGLKSLAYDLVKEGVEHENAIGRFLQDWLDGSDHIIVSTSGSTGKPKKISLKKVHMVNSALATGQYFELKSKDTALLCLSANYIAGKMMLVRAMVLGLELDYVEPSSNPLSGISRKYDFCAMVPLQVENSIDKLYNIKKLIVGGASISQKLQVQIEEQVRKTRIFETYGMTETITHVAVKKISDVRSSIVETCFSGLPSVTFSIDNKNCLLINAPKIANEIVVTNDVVKLISETEFDWLGRYDNVINSGGVKLFPEQIEAKLETIISNRFFVTGFSDGKLGQKLVLIIEGKTDIELLSQKIASLSSLKKFEIPKEIHLLPEFIETETGKIRRKENAELILG